MEQQDSKDWQGSAPGESVSRWAGHTKSFILLLGG